MHLNHSFTYAWVATKGPFDFRTNDSVPVTEEMKAESLFTKQFNGKIRRSSWLSDQCSSPQAAFSTDKLNRICPPRRARRLRLFATGDMEARRKRVRVRETGYKRFTVLGIQMRWTAPIRGLLTTLGHLTQTPQALNHR